MRLFHSIFLFLLSFLLVLPLGADELTPEKENEIRIYLENNDDMQVVIDEANKDFETKLVLLKENYKKEMGDVEVSERYFEIMKEEFYVLMNTVMQKHMENVDRSLLQFMHENFTYEEVKALNEFYAKGVGKKILEHKNEIYKISAEMSRNIIADVTPVFQERIDQRIKEEGIELFSEKKRNELSQASH